ncbi:helix-turn-helix domain-containing protein [Mucilaginibacter paludis]|uniref:DNA binding domain protein, excisionase family n=1 Tax=Mucilaginibacter paludis DSM 18603 TaxID=714943 RepID=H1Y7C4_9SPHI|nr:helix-turn-helix domain-containing protein [Mucilaginibacter paludis]EHQ29011.1 DNA binding domain protein, excisionase family [Mucilaginibacter paludis DSM 18603]
MEGIILTTEPQLRLLITETLYSVLKYGDIPAPINAQGNSVLKSDNIDFTRKQACEDLQISLKTLNTLLRTGQIEYYNIGRSVRISRNSIQKFKASQK